MSKVVEEYRLTIQTSDRCLTAGTDATVYAKLTGEEGATTKWEKLDYFFKNDFRKGSTETYTIRHKGEDNVGPPIILHFKLKGLTWLDSWLCDDVTVQYKEQIFTFPVFEWVENEEVAVCRGEANLPQKLENEFVKFYRKIEVSEKKHSFPWQQKAGSKEELSWGVCRYMCEETDEEVPSLFRNSLGRLKQKGQWTLKSSLNTATNLFQGLFTKLQVLDDYRKLYRNIGAEDPEFIFSWRKDEEMGRQMLNGVSPIAFKRCNQLPSYCDITDNDVSNLLGDGKTLEDEMKEGKIFIADYTFARKVKRNINPTTEERFVHADCVGMFRASEGKFLPIAIQLVPGTRDHIFTPNDTDYDWLLAKMYFRSSAQNFHQWIYRHLHTHAVSETFAVATFRDLSRNHPLYKLLRPHLRTAIDVNKEIRDEIIPPDSEMSATVSLQIASLIRKAYKTFNLCDLNIPELMDKKGLDDRDVLPNYFYRDDALELWKIIETYAGSVLKIYYKCDKDIVEDYELQAWAHDLAHEGFGWQDGNTRGMPDRIHSVQQLVRLSTMIIFTSSVQHAAVTNGQMEAYQFIPNAPCAMLLPVHKKGEATLDRIMESLPDIKTSSFMISYVCALSEHSKDEVFLGDIPEKLFVEEEVLEIQKEFQSKLEDLSLNIEKRSDAIGSYVSLHPKRIPLCIYC